MGLKGLLPKWLNHMAGILVLVGGSKLSQGWQTEVLVLFHVRLSVGCLCFYTSDKWFPKQTSQENKAKVHGTFMTLPSKSLNINLPYSVG